MLTGEGDRVSFILMPIITAVCLSWVMFLGIKPASIYYFESLMFVVGSGYLLFYFGRETFRGIPSGYIDLQKFLLWMAMLYLVPFLIFNRRLALILALLDYGVVLLVSAAFFLLAARTAAFVNSLNLVLQILISNLLYIVVFSFVLYLKEQILSSEAQSDMLQNLANRDPLTNLFNRRKINAALEQLITQHAPFTIIILDVDDFKQINDVLGHDAGDRVLTCFANRLRSAVRKDDLIGRWGGDEFILVCPALDDQQTCLIVERLDGIGEMSEADDLPGFRTSHGVATYRPGDSVDTLLKRADNELYAQKRQKGDVQVETA